MLVVLLILIFVRPFISSLTFLIFPYESVIYSILIFGFLIVWFIVKKVSLSTIKPIRYPLTLFILALFISLTLSQNKIAAIIELYKYATVILLFLVIISVPKESLGKIVICIIISGLLISFYSIRQYLFVFPHLSGYISKQGISDPFILDYVSQKRVLFPFVTPNILGGYLAMIIPLTLSYKNRIWLVAPLLFALLLTRSLGGLLSLFIGLIIYFYLLGKLEKKRLIFLSGLLIIIILVLITRFSTQKQHLQPIFSTMMRLNYWKDTWQIIKIYPLTGVGLGNFNLAQSRYAHNSYLQIWAEMGILGIISILWLVLAVFKSVFVNIKNASQKNLTISLISANAIFLAHNFVDFTFFLPEVAMIWWIILGLSLSKTKGNEPDNRNSDF